MRNILDKMHIHWIEAFHNHQDTDFCGNSLYRQQPPRNPKLAPRHYVDGTKGLFLPHTEEEQKEIMREYCSHYGTNTVICYCHYCLEGLKNGGKDGRHLAELLFPIAMARSGRGRACRNQFHQSSSWAKWSGSRERSTVPAELLGNCSAGLFLFLRIWYHV